MNTLLIIYLFLINLAGFYIMLIDKRRAIKNQWRISEKSLIGISIIGGSIGIYLGMKLFKHKTKHKKFTLGIPFIILSQITIFIYLQFIIKL